MRVIDHEGQVGTIIHRHRCHGYVTVRFDGGAWWTVFESSIRPLGPIEEELRRCVGKDGMPNENLCLIPDDDGFWMLYNQFSCAAGTSVLDDDCDALSEALEACARVYEEHGVAL